MSEDSNEFSITVKPTRKGFVRDGQFYRLWTGQTNTGQEVILTSFAIQCAEDQFEGFDYTPIDLSGLPDLPEDVHERTVKVRELLAAVAAK